MSIESMNTYYNQWLNSNSLARIFISSPCESSKQMEDSRKLCAVFEDVDCAVFLQHDYTPLIDAKAQPHLATALYKGLWNAISNSHLIVFNTLSPNTDLPFLLGIAAGRVPVMVIGKSLKGMMSIVPTLYCSSPLDVHRFAEQLKAKSHISPVLARVQYIAALVGGQGG